MKVVKPLAAGLLTRAVAEGASTRLAITVITGFSFTKGEPLMTDASLYELAEGLLGGAPLDLGLPKPRGELLVTGAGEVSIEPSIQGFFVGDERFTIARDPSPFEGALPGVAARVFVTTAREPALREVKLALDTVHLFPDAARGALIFRGLIDVEDELGEDVTHLLAAIDDLTAPRTAAHYEAVFAARIDPERGYEVALRDEDLVPARLLATDRSGPQKSRGIVAERLRGRAAIELDRARDAMRSLGLDPGVVMPEPDRDAMDRGDLRALMEPARAVAEEQRARATRAREEAEIAIASRCEALGLDLRALRGTAQPFGIPQLSAAAQMERIEALRAIAARAGVTMPSFGASFASDLERAEALAIGVTSAVSHHAPAPDRARTSTALRDALSEAAQRKERIAERDLSGADLSNLELDGLDLSGVLLNGADLSGTSLAGASLAGASLARANLNAADLSGAKLTGANLGGARLRGALLRGVDLGGVTLVRADLSGAEMEGAILTAADLSEAVLAGAHLRGVIASGALLVRVDLSNVSLAGATLDRATILHCDLRAADLSGASLVSATLLGVKADRSIGRESVLDNLRVLEGSSLRGADLWGAKLRGANLRGADLAGATLANADLSGADLSGASLAGADLRWAVAADARLLRADLQRVNASGASLLLAILIRADLRGANLSGTNLHRADLTSVTTDGETTFERALMTHTRFEPIVAGLT